MYGTHTLAFQRIFVRMKIISLIFIRFSYVSLIRNSVTGPIVKLLLYALFLGSFLAQYFWIFDIFDCLQMDLL